MYRFIVLCSLAFFAAGCSHTPEVPPQQKKVKGQTPCSAYYDEKQYRLNKKAKVEIGNASYYAACMNGRHTSSGELCDLHKFTAAHKTLPFGTMVRVTMLQNGKSVIVKVNDRGSYVRGRVIDLSTAAARKIGLIRAGVAKVKVERLEKL
ncbi:MAG: septal ring lytic transglycosylase RlpA family protein [Campylobacterales bacterium]|nr:septal ring lytic transglycosylase RlpA family protein [Campylobacterales bacterium]